MSETAKVHPAWKTAAEEPMFPVNDVAYLIDVGIPPTEGVRDGTTVMTTKEGKKLKLWDSTFRQLCDILDRNNWKHSKVVFSRARGSKVTTVRLA